MTYHIVIIFWEKIMNIYQFRTLSSKLFYKFDKFVMDHGFLTKPIGLVKKTLEMFFFKENIQFCHYS